MGEYEAWKHLAAAWRDAEPNEDGEFCVLDGCLGICSSIAELDKLGMVDGTAAIKMYKRVIVEEGSRGGKGGFFWPHTRAGADARSELCTRFAIENSIFRILDKAAEKHALCPECGEKLTPLEARVHDFSPIVEIRYDTLWFRSSCRTKCSQHGNWMLVILSRHAKNGHQILRPEPIAEFYRIYEKEFTKQIGKLVMWIAQ